MKKNQGCATCGDPPEHVFMITAYLDESEHSDASKYTVVAGFRGKKKQWESLVSAWKEALGARKHLHMGELRWNDSKAEKRVRPLLGKLGPIPYECGLIPVFGAVKTADYFDLIRDDPQLSQFGGYLLSISHVFTTLLETIPAHERIKIVCEAQETYESFVHEVFAAFQKTAANEGYAQLVSIDFVPKGFTSMTEPGDYLAFAIAKEFSELGGKKELWSRPIKPEPEEWKPPCRTGMWLPRNVARETILQIKASRRHQ
jgi:hypothetical protein